MKFIVDAQLPRGLCRWLERHGHEARHVNDIWDAPATDAQIVDHAEIAGAVLISKDEDFVSLRLPDRIALLWLRCGNTSNRGLAQWLEPQWPDIVSRLDAGARFISVD
jgi:predicted nuclease of predicted toxin-antitoxin system